MDAIYPVDGRYDPLAVPGVDPQHGNEEGAVFLTLAVDGELFALRHDQWSGTSYTWLTGLNEGYGFGISPTRDWSTDQHQEEIRSFLAGIDPTTSYLADE